MASLDIFNFTKSRVLTRLAELAYADRVDDNTPNVIAKELFPNLSDNVRRCCVYKEREIVREQAQIAVGKKPDGSKVTSNQLLYVLESSCDGCDIHKVRITDSCRKCLARSCERSCRFDAIYLGRTKMHINYEKCKGCGMCAKACSYSAIMQSERPCRKVCPTGALKHIPNKIAYIEESECINCGQCQANCPFGAISDISYMTNVIKSMNKKQDVIAMVAPAIQGQFAMAKLPQILESMYSLGFKEVYEVSLGADLVTISEAKEAKEAANEGKILTTSCCPAFVEMLKKDYPEIYQQYTSTTVSPMVAMGRVLRQKYPDAKLVFIGPCIAKKSEMKLPKAKEYVDYVLTFEEILAMMKAKGIDPINFKGEKEFMHGSAAARGYCFSGGVAQSLKVYLNEQGIENEDIKLVAANGHYECKDCLKLIKTGKFDGTVLEGMMCLGGCTGGVSSLVTNAIQVKNVNNRDNQAIQQTKVSQIMDTLGINKVDMHYKKEEN